MTPHPALDPIRPLIGTWRGEGRGEYPTIGPFEYTEELVFADVGKPFLVYSQRTWGAGGGPLHIETGYLRVPEGRLELVLAQPTGQTELAEGELVVEDAGFSAELRSTVVNSSTAKRVDSTVRRLRLAGDELETSFDMAAVGVLEPTRHLTASLRRVEPGSA